MGNFLTYLGEKVFDTFVNSIKQIDTDHYYIHEGKKFGYSENFSLLTTASKLFTFTTPSVASAKQIHFRPTQLASSGDKILIELIENNFVNGSGTNKLTSLFNYNRSSSIVSGMQFFNSGETETTPGTVILTGYIGGGTGVGGTRTGGTNEQQQERVLKVNTNYSVKVTNNSSATNIINIEFSWYEESVYS